MSARRGVLLSDRAHLRLGAAMSPRAQPAQAKLDHIQHHAEPCHE
jgi:hypothetical protein